MGPWLVCMDPGGGKITLDQESFRALASDVRVEVLKRLDARRETVTDLSNLALGAAVVLAAIGAFYLLIAGGVSSAGQTPPTNSPSIMEPVHASPGILGLVLVLLSLGSVAAEPSESRTRTS